MCIWASSAAALHFPGEVGRGLHSAEDACLLRDVVSAWLRRARVPFTWAAHGGLVRIPAHALPAGAPLPPPLDFDRSLPLGVARVPPA